jgi:hypothetical protein
MCTSLPVRAITKAQGMPFCPVACIHFSAMKVSSFFCVATV